MTTRQGFAFLGTSVGVTSDDPAMVAWLSEILLPAFDRVPFDAAAVVVEVHRDRDRYERVAATRPSGVLPTVACFVRDEKLTRRPTWEWRGRRVTGEDRLGALYFVADGRVEVLLAPDASRPRTAVMRVVRELAVAPALADPRRVLLHAAAVVHGGRAVAFAGPRTCGKTTMLTAVARVPGVAMLANDRLLLTAEPGGWRARGIPTIVSLRRGTLDLVPELRCRLPAVTVPVELTVAEATALDDGRDAAVEPERLKASPAQLACALDSTLAAEAPLAAILFPDPDGDADAVTITRVSTAEARERLRGARFGVHAHDAEPTVFAVLVGAGVPTGEDALLDRLASTIPCFVVHVGANVVGSPETCRGVLDAVSA